MSVGQGVLRQAGGPILQRRALEAKADKEAFNVHALTPLVSGPGGRDLSYEMPSGTRKGWLSTGKTCE